LNYSLFDIDRGLLLKLGEGKKVLAAMRGLKKLNQDEISNYYGKECVFEGIEWPQLYSFPE
jgi:hypothetical protein